MHQRLRREQPLGVRCRGVEQDDHIGWGNSYDRFEKRTSNVENREKRVVGDGSKVASSLRGTGMNDTNRSRVDSWLSNVLCVLCLHFHIFGSFIAREVLWQRV